MSGLDELIQGVAAVELDSGESREVVESSPSSGPEPREILLRALRSLREPEKDFVQQRAKDIVKRLRNSFRRFRFQERGSLWSPYISHVSDADVQFFASHGRGVSAQEGLRLLHKSRSVFTAFMHGKSKTGDVESPKLNELDFEAHLSRPDSHRGAVVVTGLVACGSFLIPFDIALSDEGVDHESNEQRMDKIQKKLREGNYAKVLQKVRSMVKHKGFKRVLADRVNSECGSVRFLAAQLKMICTSDLPAIDGTAYAHNVLGIDGDALPHLGPLALCAEDETQRRALSILTEMRSEIARRLGPIHGEAFRATTTHL